MGIFRAFKKILPSYNSIYAKNLILRFKKHYSDSLDREEIQGIMLYVSIERAKTVDQAMKISNYGHLFNDESLLYIIDEADLNVPKWIFLMLYFETEQFRKAVSFMHQMKLNYDYAMDTMIKLNEISRDKIPELSRLNVQELTTWVENFLTNTKYR